MVETVRVAAWARYGWLRHGFSTRLGGVSTVYGGQSLNLGWTKEDDPAGVAENRRQLAEEIAGAGALVTLRQVHGVGIHVVREGDGPFANQNGRALFEGDGLMSHVPGVLLAIQTADCVPVLLVDVERRAVGVLHAGWRGTAAGMVEQGVAAMRREFGSHPDDLEAAVGPSIGPCCYAVGQEVREAFACFAYAEALFTGMRLDLWKANRLQLLEAGVVAQRITITGECTGCAVTATGERRYFSHRIDHGVTGRMMSVVGVVPSS